MRSHYLALLPLMVASPLQARLFTLPIGMLSAGSYTVVLRDRDHRAIGRSTKR